MKIGVAFGDHIKTGKYNRRSYDAERNNRKRLFIVTFALFLLPALVLLKLFDIQIVHGGYYKTISDANRTKTNLIYPQRGVAFDRNKTPLIINRPDINGIKSGDINSNLNGEAGELITADISKLHLRSRRYYPYKEILSHVIGYVGNISDKELVMSENNLYSPDDVIGKSGLEKEYDKLLRGEYGKELVEVDAMGNTIRILGTQDPIDGKDITLTIDLNLQKVTHESFPVGKKGAVIVSRPNGEILAIVSKPSFDPNLFTLGDNYTATESSYQSVASILSDGENQPLLDRAISGVYPPGSTFKLITAAAGLENKIIDRNYKIEDTGVIRVGEFSFGNWFFLEQGKKDGMVDVVKGIARSNDIFFYKLAEKITVDNLAKTAGQFGVGKLTKIDLPEEEPGLLPTRQWKDKFIKQPWYLGDTYHYGIGQGFLLTTPIQVNLWTAALANKGVLPNPHILLKEIENKGIKLISDNNIDLIRQGMIDSCKQGGVAWPLFNFSVKNPNLIIDGKNFIQAMSGTESAVLKDYREVSIACKTGTAQHGGEETLPHAWITLFAPSIKPEIVITVIVEEAGQGSDIAAPVAKKILEEYFRNKK